MRPRSRSGPPGDSAHPMWQTSQKGARLAVKRVLDIFAALVLGAMTLPLTLLAAMAVWATMGSPVLFCQERYGRYGVPYRMVKLRTMHNRTDGEGRLLPDEQRQSRLGNVLRRSSIDELPQFWNVLRGEMSLVGNRPLPLSRVDSIAPENGRRYATLPGMADLASLRGRNLLTWEEQFAIDRRYTDNWSLWLDLCIAVGTIWLLIRNPDQPPPGQFRQACSADAPHPRAVPTDDNSRESR